MYRTIVVGTDGSSTAAEAVAVAVRLARGAGATLHLVRAFRMPSHAMAVSGAPWPALDLAGADQAVADGVAADLAVLARDIGRTGVAVRTHVRPADPAEAIVAVARAVSADVVVVGNQGMRGGRRFLGSVPNTVTHRAGCDVLLVNTCGPGRAAPHPWSMAHRWVRAPS